MGLKDIINGGINRVKGTIDQKKKNIDAYNELVSNSKPLNFIPVKEKQTFVNEDRIKKILTTSYTLNRDSALELDAYIPINETILVATRAKEAKTGKDLIFALTDKCVWIFGTNEFNRVNYSDIGEFEIVNSSLLSQGVNFSGSAFSFEGSEADIKKFIEIVLRDEKRKSLVLERNSYLCGVEPKEQILNAQGSGITIGANEEVVLHNKSLENRVVNLDDLEYLQMLVDNTVVLTKGKNTAAQVSSIVPCRKMSLKFVFKDYTFYMETMPENTMSSLVKIEDSQYQSSLNFTKRVIVKIGELIK